jgi:hypothetical protein
MVQTALEAEHSQPALNPLLIVRVFASMSAGHGRCLLVGHSTLLQACPFHHPSQLRLLSPLLNIYSSNFSWMVLTSKSGISYTILS